MIFAILVYLALALAAVGHLGIWISFWNCVEGGALPRWLRKSINLIGMLCLVGLPFWLPAVGAWDFFWGCWPAVTALGLPYLLICWGVTMIGIPYAVRRRRRFANPGCLLARKSVIKSFPQPPAASLAKGINALLMAVPGNQIYDLDAAEKELLIERMPSALDGLTIAHMSDLHFTGKLPRKFFEEVVDVVNDWKPDLIAITGDLVDCDKCMPWLKPTLGRLRCELGSYYVLGNHDMKVNVRRLREVLKECGVISVGGRWLNLAVGSRQLILAGNELPWVPPAADMTGCPRKTSDQFRLLLAHTPDQLPWARFHDFDLMLAGHTHGGQICIPPLGPVLCPTRKPLEYSVGTIHEHPTVMHVSRGISGDVPIRLNCRPEVARLVLRSAGRNSTPVANEEEKRQVVLATDQEPLASRKSSDSRRPIPR